MQAGLREFSNGNPKNEFCASELQSGRLMKIIRLWSPPRRPVEPTSANCVAGYPVNSRESTLLRSVFAGFQRRVRKTTGLSRAVVAGLAAGTALLALTGCMAATSKADLADVIVIAATATANETAPALSSANVALLQATGDSSTSAVAFVVNPANGQAAQLPLTPSAGSYSVAITGQASADGGTASYNRPRRDDHARIIWLLRLRR